MRRFKVGEWSARPLLHQLVGPEGELTIEARSMDVLVALAENAGEVVPREDLLERVWSGRFVGEEALTHAIWDLRRALGDEPKRQRFIQTIHGKGYRLVAKVSWLDDGVGEQARFVLEEEIARGAMGVVWRARDPRLERTVAVKFLPPELCRDRASKTRFLREARADARLDHPNICSIFEAGETDDGRMYLVMPLYEGETLRERIDAGPLLWAEAAHIAAEMASGLEAAHDAGLAHRDLKPEDIVLLPASDRSTGEGTPRVKILGFGLARLRGTTWSSEARASLGNLSYVSPELARREEVGPQSDLWALGVLLYEMLAGQCPFRGDNAQAVIDGILEGEPEPLPGDVTVPEDLQKLLAALLVKDPEQRASDAGHLGTALRVLLAGDLDKAREAAAARTSHPLGSTVIRKS